MKLRNAIITAAILLYGTVAAYSAGYVWWEGESPVKTNFPDKTWFSETTFQDKRYDILSGGAWLTNADKRTGPEAYAVYAVDVPETAEYEFWTRKFWKHGPFRWRFDDQPWQICGKDIGLADSVDIRKFLCVNWVNLGSVKLAKGRHRFELRLLAEKGENQTACFDCFILSKLPFVPHGKFKPGEKSGLAPDGWWAFEPAADSFGDALLDLRSLNEDTAGQDGFLRRDGSRILLGSGKPVRFWAVNCGPGIVNMGHSAHDYLARRLAKAGVNMVRIHGPVFDHQNGSDPAKLDASYLDNYFHFIYAMKKHGIYTELSFYFPLWFAIKPECGIEGYETIDNKKPFALLYFNDRMQNIYRQWAKSLLLTLNPYTGTTLAKEPAVGIIELVNEDSYFFWTFSRSNIPEVQMHKLEALYGQWLKARYGSLADAVRAWGGAEQKKDAPAQGRMMLMDAWFMTANGHKGEAMRRRMSDQVRFLAENQLQFYKETVGFLRNDIGTKSLITCSNWKTADARTLGAIERLTYRAGDVIDRHGYFGGPHKGPRAGYSVSAGDTYQNLAGVKHPESLPIAVNQVSDYPQIVSEIGWTSPNRFQSECPLLCSAYASLQGIDGLFFFAIGGMDWESSPRKFALSVPSILGQFPAAALAYRKGYIAESQPAVQENLNLQDLFALKGSYAQEPLNLDELRKADIPKNRLISDSSLQSVDPLTYFAGKVERNFGTGTQNLRIVDLSKLIDRDRKEIRSLTGQLQWDYGTGLITVNAPKAQGATGFLAAAVKIELADLTIECGNEFGSIMVVPLDDQPIADSKELLVQVMTEDRFYGWKTQKEGDMLKIVDLGGYPINVRTIDAAITFKHRRTQAGILDSNGYLLKKKRLEPAARGTILKLEPDSLYTIVR